LDDCKAMGQPWSCRETCIDVAEAEEKAGAVPRSCGTGARSTYLAGRHGEGAALGLGESLPGSEHGDGDNWQRQEMKLGWAGGGDEESCARDL
jgi:hypothetical protein